jgi:hypothetical protein
MGVTGIFEELRRGIEAGDRLDVLEKFQNLFVDPGTLPSTERQACRFCEKIPAFKQILIFKTQHLLLLNICFMYSKL